MTNAIRKKALLLSLAVVFYAFSQAQAAQNPAKPGDFFDQVAQKARQLSQANFETPRQVPEFMRSLHYNDWRQIRFRTEKSLWADEKGSFSVQFFHPGFLYDHPVQVNVIEGKKISPLNFSTDYFNYGQTGLAEKIPADLGFAGLRIHFPLNKPAYKDEFVVFLGASYFRAIAKGQNYGLSARGLAIDTGMPQGEEFPFFKEFWLVKPAKSAKQITVYALLDSQSLTGAYEFIIIPGKETVMQVRARIFFRVNTEVLGIAPLTSMFYYGENKGPNCVDDFRQEVHDSDGLSMELSKEWIWRPLVNPQQLFINVFQAPGLKGFGLLQRDTEFDHYLDLETNFQQRPSTWVKPKGDWGRGSIWLIQIPTRDDKNDNIVAFWVPQNNLAAHQEAEFSYSLHWGDAANYQPPVGRVVWTRYMHGADNKLDFYVEFEGKELSRLDPEAKLGTDISVPPGYQLNEAIVHKNNITGGWRLALSVTPPVVPAVEKLIPGKKPAIELRAALTKDNNPLTETWSFALDNYD